MSIFLIYFARGRSFSRQGPNFEINWLETQENMRAFQSALKEKVPGAPQWSTGELATQLLLLHEGRAFCPADVFHGYGVLHFPSPSFSTEELAKFEVAFANRALR